MLSVTPVSSAGTAGSYYAADNYYTADEAHEASAWVGKGADDLGLSGPVEETAFTAVLAGHLPDGSQITAMRGEHRPGLDLTFSASKSVSLFAILTGDQRIVDAFRQSVSATLGWAERHLIEAKVWDAEAGRQKPEKTGNMVAATFLHDVNRNNDPQLHIHSVIANTTLASDGKWHAVHNDQIYQNQHLLGTIHNSELRSRIEALGYETVPAKNPRDAAFEIKGISRGIIDAFSTRRAEIEAALSAGDRGSAREREIAALATRQAKTDHLTPAERSAAWQTTTERVGFDGKPLIDAALARASTEQTIWSRVVAGVRGIGAKGLAIASAMGITPKDGDALVPERFGHLSPTDYATAQAVASATRELGEREAAFDRHDLIRLSLERGGPVTLADVEARIALLAEKGLIIGSDRMVTTEGAIQLEQRVIELAEAGRGRVKPILDGPDAATQLQQTARALGMHSLNPGQEAAGVAVLTSPDRVQLIQGGAGVGKSAALKPVAQIAMEKGHNVIALAHAGRTARDFGAKIGAPASTVDSFLARNARILDGRASPSHLAKAAAALSGSVIMVDEASQIGTERFGKLIELANRFEAAKLVFAGDTRQLPAIEAGRPHAQLQQEGLPTSHVTDNLRAQSPQMIALNTALADGDIARAFAILKTDTIEAPFAQGPETAAKLWADLPLDQRDQTILLAAGRSTRSAGNEAVQDELKSRGELSGPSLELTVLDRVNSTREGVRQMLGYKADRIVEFRTNLPSQGFVRGDMGAVLSAEDNKVQIEMADGSLKEFEPGRLPRNLSHDAVSIYQEKSISLHEQDRIRWTDNDHARGLLNGDTARIEAIKGDQVTLSGRDGEAQTLDIRDPMLARLDLAYAINAHIAQGAESPNGIAVMSERETQLNTAQTFLVTLTRIVDHVSLVVDNVAALERQVTMNSGEKPAALDVQRAPELMPGNAPVKENSHDMDFGM